MGEEDKRTAIGMSVTLSSQLIAAALAMLAIEGAYVAFALGNRKVTTAFFLVAGLAALGFIGSIFVAGKGITKARNAGFNGNWNLKAGKSLFDWQAGLNLLGLLALVVVLFLSVEPKESTFEIKLEELNQSTSTLDSTLQTISQQTSTMNTSLKSIDSNIHKIQKGLDRAIKTEKSQSGKQTTGAN